MADYEFKVTRNGGWEENWGLDGVADGPNIGLSVPGDQGTTAKRALP